MALEDRAIAELALGHHATVAADLEAMTVEYPLRERLWGLRALALTRAGRQADALQVLRQVRDVLDDELGIEPSVELRDLQTAVLRQDTSLEWVAPPRRPGAPIVPTRPEPAPAPAPTGADWPMVGREADLAALTGAWERARGGATTYAVLTGEPGIGKSRLAAELTEIVRGDGAQVCVGRCSQDDGAPPLWPWAQVLEAFGKSLPENLPDDGRDQFRGFEQIVHLVLDAARERPLVVGLDDLHWADPCSLRVLRLLAETATDEPLLVLATWRDNPEPTGSLADVAETLARRHAVRRALERACRPTPWRRCSRAWPATGPRRTRRMPCTSAPTGTRSSSWSTPGWPASGPTCPASSPRSGHRPGCTRYWSVASPGCPRRPWLRCARPP